MQNVHRHLSSERRDIMEIDFEGTRVGAEAGAPRRVSGYLVTSSIRGGTYVADKFVTSTLLPGESFVHHDGKEYRVTKNKFIRGNMWIVSRYYFSAEPVEG